MTKVTNRRLVSSEGPDYYPTPSWGTKALLHYEKFYGPIWEPCCGDGAMSDVLLNNGYEVASSDIHDRGFGFIADFLTYDYNNVSFNNIVTNPPFNLALPIIKHALNIVDEGKVCFLLRTAFLESQIRYKELFSVDPPNRVYVFSERLSMYPAGQKGVSGGTTSYSWFVWDRKLKNERTELLWIEPGLKE